MIRIDAARADRWSGEDSRRVLRWTTSAEGHETSVGLATSPDRRREGDEFDYACWRVTGSVPRLVDVANTYRSGDGSADQDDESQGEVDHLLAEPPQIELAGATGESPRSSPRLCYVSPSLLLDPERLDWALERGESRGEQAYLPLVVASHAERDRAVRWIRRAAWVELDYRSLCHLTGRTGDVVER